MILANIPYGLETLIIILSCVGALALGGITLSYIFENSYGKRNWRRWSNPLYVIMIVFLVIGTIALTLTGIFLWEHQAERDVRNNLALGASATSALSDILQKEQEHYQATGEYFPDPKTTQLEEWRINNSQNFVFMRNDANSAGDDNAHFYAVLAKGSVVTWCDQNGDDVGCKDGSWTPQDTVPRYVKSQSANTSR